MSVSDDFYNNLLANSADAKRLISLERLKTACDALEKQPKASEYTVADIGRYCERQWGGPKSQSIRNAPDVLKKYVELRITEHTEKLGPQPNQPSIGKRQLNMADPAIAQQQFQLALAEIHQLKAEVARLKADVQNYAPLTPDQLVSLAKSGAGEPYQATVRAAAPAEVVTAICTLFDKQRLRGCELILDANGYLVNEVTGNELLPADAVLALKRFAEEVKRISQGTLTESNSG
ncbi:gamma-mobile-trio protein GmtX [Herbaspirillum huttiense]|uniref:gamma-mobile-trio protein GmtX n=1 Tax=Herbaspirillum huttiense TaxID=863372 RepID=UPI0031D2335B